MRIITPNRDRAEISVFWAFRIRVVFSFLYALFFESLNRVNWWLDILFGLIHGLIVLIAIIPMLPEIHPRMASEKQGPTPTRMIEPPGFMALNYGRRNPLSTLYSATIS